MSHAHDESAGAAGPQVVVGQKDQMVNLSSFVDAENSQVLNADSRTSLKSVLGATPGVLRSDADTDAELVMVVSFREAVKLRGIKLTASEARTEGDADQDASGPATVKLFLSQPHYSFAECASETPTETLQVTLAQLQSGVELPLRFVKWQNVTSVTIFIQSNQDDSPVSFINQLSFIGAPLEGTNMKALKAISCDC